jgi:hypothetical protein
MVSSIVVWVVGLVGWSLIDSTEFLLILIFLPFVWACGLTAFANWVRNDY